MKNICIVLAVLACVSSCSEQEGAVAGVQSGIAVLVDFSQSFAPLNNQDLSALKTVGQAVRILALRGERQPTKIQWLAITDDSKRAQALCGGPRVFQIKLTSLGYVSPEYITTPSALIEWLGKVCPDSVVAQSKGTNAPFTDISGAVSLASASLSAVRGDRVLILYSDFLEDLPTVGAPMMPKLNGYRALFVWRPGVDTSHDMDKRLSGWVSRFKAAGARTCLQPAVSVIPDDIVACLTQGTQ